MNVFIYKYLLMKLKVTARKLPKPILQLAWPGCERKVFLNLTMIKNTLAVLIVARN